VLTSIYPILPFENVFLHLNWPKKVLYMKLTYYGHACFGVETASKNLLFDPFISPNELASNIDIKTINADYILLSHGHADHVADCVSIAQQTDAMVIGAFEVTEWASNQGVAKTHPMNTGGQRPFDFGSVKCVNALHSSSLPDGSYGGNPMGFIVTSEQHSFYYSGDTALTLDMQLIPRWAKLDFAVLCIGDNFTMGYEDAIEAAKMIQCNTIVGVHYDTFGYIKIDKEAARQAFTNAGMTLHLPGIGETLEL
jgi:L-ascorbate metabolism protein UlaG (beta-lactamase superfamily)